MNIEATQQKVREAIKRLEAAAKYDFPWNVRFQLLNETMTAQCEHQLALSEALLSLIEEVRTNNTTLLEKVKRIFTP